GVAPSTIAAALANIARRIPMLAVASQAEREYAQTLAQRSGLDLEVTQSTDRWKHLIAGAEALIAPDSGAAHLAGMTGTGCVDLFPDGPDVAQALQRWFPWASPRQWTIALTPRIAAHIEDQLRIGVAYAMGRSAAEIAR